MMGVSWTRKYSPRKAEDVIGQSLPIQRLRRFLGSYRASRKKAAILYGLTGCGKTSSVYAIASELNLEVLEINASDFRNASSINNVVGNAASQLSLFGRGKVILVDELDGISGQHDRGGVAALAKLLSKSAFPIVMTANDPWDKKFSSLRRSSEMIEFRQLTPAEANLSMRKICAAERIDADETALLSLANRSGGDLRAAINDLQIIAGATRKIAQHGVDSLSDRNRVDSMLTAITKILKTLDLETAASSLDEVNEQPNEWFLWIDENIPAEYKNPKVIAKAYDALSSADVFSGRIRNTQYWRLLVYIKFLLSAGVALAKDSKSDAPANYKQSSRILKIWIANARYGKRKNIAEKIAAVTHTSPKKVINNFHFYRTIIKSSPALAGELSLDEEEVEWLAR